MEPLDSVLNKWQMLNIAGKFLCLYIYRCGYAGQQNFCNVCHCKRVEMKRRWLLAVDRVLLVFILLSSSARLEASFSNHNINNSAIGHQLRDTPQSSSIFSSNVWTLFSRRHFSIIEIKDSSNLHAALYKTGYDVEISDFEQRPNGTYPIR